MDANNLKNSEDFTTPLDCLYRWEKERPGANYLHQPWPDGRVETFTWGRVMKEARSMAAHLQSLQLEPKSQVALMSSNCAHWLMADYAIWMAGHVSVPIFPTLGKDEVSYIVQHSESKVFFAGKMEHWEQVKPGISIPCIAFPHNQDDQVPSWNKIVAETAPLSGNPNREMDELASIIYTSGSTGTPKGVMIHFRHMAMAAIGFKDILVLSPADRMISYLPLSHVAERMLVDVNSVYRGFEVFFAHSLDTFLQDLQRAHPTLFFSVPRLWIKFQMGVFEKVPRKKLDFLLKIPILSSLLKKKIIKGLGLDAVRYAGSGAAPIPRSLLEWYQKLGLEIIEGYGMTENFAYSHVNEPGNVKFGSVGKNNPLVESKIDENGEVLIKSPSNMAGYFKDPEKTKEALREDGYLRTGDMGRFDEQGRLTLTGRVKEQFKTTKGEYIAPAPIEDSVMQHDKIEMACVCGEGLNQPLCLVNLSEQGQAEYGRDQRSIAVDLGRFLERINQGLMNHERIASFVVIPQTWQPDNGFLTPTLKIKRHVIEKEYGAQFEGWESRKEAVICL